MRFGLRTLLLAMAAVAISVTGMTTAVGLYHTPAIVSAGAAPGEIQCDLANLASWAALSAPCWMPLVIIAFAAGRRSLTVMVVACLAIFEATAVGIAFAVWAYSWTVAPMVPPLP